MTAVTVYSAHKLSKELLAQVQQLCKSRFGTTKVDEAVDPELIAGIRLVSGSQVVEVSLKDLFDQLIASI